jgi:hypothetical protein
MDLVDLDGDGDLDLHLAGHGCIAAAARNDGRAPRYPVPGRRNTLGV